MYTDLNHSFTVARVNVWRIKVKLRLPPHLYSVTPLPYLVNTLLLISMLHLRMCNILKFTQNTLVVLIPYLLTFSRQCFVTTLLRQIVLRVCIESGRIEKWIISSDLHYLLWQTIDDGEGYVRAAVVSALASLHTSDTLWQDFTHRHFLQARHNCS